MDQPGLPRVKHSLTSVGTARSRERTVQKHGRGLQYEAGESGSAAYVRRSIGLGNRRVSAGLCATDLVRSQEFYEQKVGLKLSPETIKNHLLVEGGDGTT